jgi:DNA-binding response OmpR family regulator
MPFTFHGAKKRDHRGTIVTVLIVEDNETLREGMAQILAKMGLEVLQAPDGATALPLLQQPVGLVISD